jgi:hypothetical protein
MPLEFNSGEFPKEGSDFDLLGQDAASSASLAPVATQFDLYRRKP